MYLYLLRVTVVPATTTDWSVVLEGRSATQCQDQVVQTFGSLVALAALANDQLHPLLSLARIIVHKLLPKDSSWERK